MSRLFNDMFVEAQILLKAKEDPGSITLNDCEIMSSFSYVVIINDGRFKEFRKDI